MPATPHRVWQAMQTAAARLNGGDTHACIRVSQRAESVADAATLLAASGDAKLLAGGQTLIAAMKLRLAQPGDARRPGAASPS